MADPRQITELPVAATSDDVDLMLTRQGLFDKQVTVELVREPLLRIANNLSDLDDPATARTNLGVTAAADVLLAANNLNDLDNVVTARTNLGVSATADTLLVANDLSDLNDPATARSNLGVVASTNTAVTNATNDFNFNIQQEMQILHYSEDVNAVGNITGAAAFNFTAGNVQTATVTGNVNISFSNPAASGQASSMTLILDDGGAFTITWDASILWAGGTAPTLTTAGTDLLVFTTIDNGTTYYGAVAALDLS
jgi:hypothetical protein